MFDASRVAAVLSSWKTATEDPEHESTTISTPRARLPFLDQLVQKEAVAGTHTNSNPLCRPWSRDEFTKRTATFKSWLWFAKPNCIGPLQCALHGWTNSDVDMLRCQSCETQLCFKVSDTIGLKEMESVASRYAAQLPVAHKPCCPWYKNASPASFSVNSIPHLLSQQHPVPYSLSHRITSVSLLYHTCRDFRARQPVRCTLPSKDGRQGFNC